MVYLDSYLDGDEDVLPILGERRDRITYLIQNVIDGDAGEIISFEVINEIETTSGLDVIPRNYRSTGVRTYVIKTKNKGV